MTKASINLSKCPEKFCTKSKRLSYDKPYDLFLLCSTIEEDECLLSALIGLTDYLFLKPLWHVFRRSNLRITINPPYVYAATDKQIGTDKHSRM